ncbi:MAG: phosphoglycerol geranylgeranyltransferase [Candidatus Thermoplasmatota archaeon]|nr:phosphoglycerol geranylgeranyltransferase [Candidatus Thermoplasmatota archaeon]
MNLWNEILSSAGDGGLHATLIDPATTGPEAAGELAAMVEAAGTDLFLFGGSTGVTREGIEATVEAVAEASDKPRLLFPSSSAQMARGLDGILFTLTLNSTLPACIVGEQAKGAEPVVQAGLPTITTAYLIVEPGMTVGRVTEADLLTRDEAGIQRARAYAYLARVLGLDAIYLEAGSGAGEPVPSAMVEAAVASGVPVIQGGGIRTPEQAQAALDAGAKVIVTGTVAERGDHKALEAIIHQVRRSRG